MKDNYNAKKSFYIPCGRISGSSIENNIFVMTYEHDNLIQFEHSHSLFELGYLREGSIIHRFPDKSAYMEKGDYFIIDIGDTHSYKSSKKDDRLVMQNCLFSPRFIDTTFNENIKFKEILSSPNISIDCSYLKKEPTSTVYHDDNGEISTLLNMLEQEKNDMECNYHIMKKLLAVVLIKTMTKISKVNVNHSNDLVNTIITYATEHYNENDILTSFSQYNYYSLPYLSSVFRKETGISFRKYIQKIRIDEACHLLLESNYSVSQISGRIGYKSETQFHKAFFEITGMTPLKYRSKIIQK